MLQNKLLLSIKKFIDDIKKYGAYLCNKEEKAKLEKYMFQPNKDGVVTGVFPGLVGHPAWEIAHNAGFEVPHDTPILMAECSKVGPEEPLTREKHKTQKYSETDDSL